MFRCAFAVATAFALAMPAGAQVQRNFPQNALRGEIMIGTPPEITLNGAATRLAPGARIRNQNNLLEMSGALVGNKFVVALHDRSVGPGQGRVDPSLGGDCEQAMADHLGGGRALELRPDRADLDQALRVGR